MILIGPCTDPFDPVAVKASMGAVFSVPVAAAESAGGVPGLVPGARDRGRRDVGLTGAGTFWEARLPAPLAILLGSEGAGLPDDLLAAGDLRLRIPMTGTAESLNLAVAAGILLYETWRQIPA